MTNKIFDYKDDVLTCTEYGNEIRWAEGERLDHLFEQSCDKYKDHAAVLTNNGEISYSELDNRANKTARFLLSQGLENGERVGLLFPNSEYSYIGQLATLKINAAYVPFDASFPEDRIAYICSDAGINTILTLSQYKEHVEGTGLKIICLDENADKIDMMEGARLSLSEKGESRDELSYIIYTSGTTGNPKGVPIDHASICNFVRVAAEVYGYQQSDRVYQGMTIAFDFSIEELWVPWIAGSTLVPGKADTKLVGNDLADYLIESKITALCCVPTLLATIEKDLPDLRLLLVSGEACPQDLVTRWKTPERVMLNVYGPTETTVTATWVRMEPGNAVTIGGPLPTYSIVILDAEKDKVVKKGETGEVAIAGIGLARGYLNRDDLTEKVFINDFLDLPNNPSKRIYRSGDLGRITDENEIEYLGRIDTQVKIRGYRIELTEIETVLLEVPGIAQAVVDTYEVEPGSKDLVAYCTLKDGMTELPSEEISKALKAHLPAYMIPSYIELLDIIPMLPSHKADRKKLPAPISNRFVMAGGEYFAPVTETEKVLEKALVKILKVERVSIKDDFFKDLGAHSLLMAQFSAEIKNNLPKAQLSIRDIYFHPSLVTLAEYLDKTMAEAKVKVTQADCKVPTNMAYYGCGLMQFAWYATTFSFAIWFLLTFFNWTIAATSIIDVYVRTVSFTVLSFLGFAIAPIIAKWLIIGRFKSQKVPLWSFAYFRFWLVRGLMENNPLILFRGTPLYNLYLRLLGAKIGKNSLILSRKLPVCTDLISIGENTIINKDSVIPSFKAEGGYLRTGQITIGDNVYVGEGSMIDINTVMGNDTQLGNASTLQENQQIPDGKHFHGNPAEPTELNYNNSEQLPSSPERAWYYTGFIAATAFLGLGPLTLTIIYYVFPEIFTKQSGVTDFVSNLPVISPEIIGTTLTYATVMFFGSLILGLLLVALLPRLLGMMIETDKTYPLYGRHYYFFSILLSVSNSNYFNVLFGDSSYAVNYLKMIGYRFPNLIQTGSNFGNRQKHDAPHLCEIGSGTFVSDGLAMMNSEISTTSFKLSDIKIGASSFFGNNVFYPANGKTGENCLFATKVLVPIDGPVRENTGLLGSPAFEIPRTVSRDEQENVEELKNRQLPKKNQYNIFTIALFLFSQWVYLSASLLFFYWALTLLATHGGIIFGTALAIYSLVTILYWGLISRYGFGFKTIKPFDCSIYNPYFWQIERYWKMNESPLLQNIFKGTPFRNLITALRGAKIGTKVYDDGCSITEMKLVTIGDYCNLNEGAILQGHTLEDGMFKSDNIKLGNGCTLGTNAYVQYGTTLNDNSYLTTDSFLMKGEVMANNSIWQGNPAEEI